MVTNPNAASSQPSGAPRWTYAVAAIVSVVGAAWAIASHFIPKAEPAAKPSMGAAGLASTPGAASVSVSGSGNVGMVNNSGTITVGVPPAPSEPAKAGKP